MLNNPEYNLVSHLNDIEYKLFRQTVIALVSTSEPNFTPNKELIDILEHNKESKSGKKKKFIKLNIKFIQFFSLKKKIC